MSGQPLHREGSEGRSTDNMTTLGMEQGDKDYITGAFTLSTHRQIHRQDTVDSWPKSKIHSRIVF